MTTTAPPDHIEIEAPDVASGPAPGRGGLLAWYAERRGRGALEIAVLFVLLQSALVVWHMTDSKGRYLSSANLSVMTQSIPWLGLLAIGVGIVLVAGEIDISVAMNMGMCELVWLTWYSGGHSALLCSVLAISLGIGIGLFNAFLVNVFRIPSLIATLGMYGVLWGAAQWYVGGEGQAPRVTSDKMPDSLDKLVTGELGFGVRAQMVWFVIVAALMWVLLHRHKLGNHIQAVGGNESAAKAISISPDKVRYLAFGLLGMLAGIAAVLLSVQQRTLVPGSTAGLELEAIGAAVIGGTALRGGKGSVLGMVLGVGFVKTFQAIVLLSTLPAFYLKTYIGAMTILFAIVNQFLDGKAE